MKKLFFITGLFCIISAILSGQEQTVQVQKNEMKTVVDSIGVMLEREYVYEDVGKQMSSLVRQQFEDGSYDISTDPEEFARAITQDLRSISHDKHLAILYNPERIKLQKEAENNDEGKHKYEELRLQQLKRNNFGFQEVKILPGNIGYINFTSFADPEFGNAGQTAIAALQFVTNTDALIFDLRQNGGGSPGMIQLISSYLFEEPEHLNSFYWRPTDEYKQFWTLSYVPGEKLLQQDIYVLTSSYTFSAAEEFTYNLKNMKRGTIVGDTTGGGAHPVGFNIINDNFALKLPKGRAINPITETNWEGTGIAPNYPVASDDALNLAQKLALDSLLKRDYLDEETKQELQWKAERLATQLNPYTLDPKTAKKYVGDYGPRHITMENDQLYYQRDERSKYRMIPINENTFMFDEIDYFKLQIIRANDKVTGVKGIYDNGRTDMNPVDK